MNFNKITTRLAVLASTLVVSASCTTAASLQPESSPQAQNQSQDQTQTQALPYDGSWESLQTMPVPAWFDDGKIGIFIHWGPYSAVSYTHLTLPTIYSV